MWGCASLPSPGFLCGWLKISLRGSLCVTPRILKCMCVCLAVCLAVPVCVCFCMCVYRRSCECIWRSEMNLRQHFFSFLLLPETGLSLAWSLLTGPGWLLVSPGTLLSLPLQCKNSSYIQLAFIQWSWVSNSVLHEWRELYQLSYPPSLQGSWNYHKTEKGLVSGNILSRKEKQDKLHCQTSSQINRKQQWTMTVYIKKKKKPW